MKTILILDDDPSILKYFEMRLGDTYTVITTTEWKVAFDYIKNNPLLCLIVDYSMPVINGIEVTKIIRSLPELKNIPIILITGMKDIALVEEAYEAGVNIFMTKSEAITKELIDRMILQAEVLQRFKNNTDRILSV